MIDDSERGPRDDASGRLRRRFVGADEIASPDDADPSAHANGPRSGFPAADELTPQDHHPIERFRSRFIGWDAGALPDEPGAPPLADGTEPEFDEPTPPPRRFVAITAFFLLMAAIGSGSGAIWHYYGPEWAPGGTQVDETAQAVARLAEEQRRLAQSIAALQLTQDALQKHISAREQEVARLSAEIRSLKSDLENLRAAAANVAPHQSHAQTPRAPQNAVSSKKKKTEPKLTAEPKREAEPMALSPQPK